MTILLTGEDLLAMGENGHYELIDGRLIEQTPAGDAHAFVEFNLGGELRNFIRQQQTAWVLGGEVGIYIRRSPDRIRAADVVVVSKAKLPALTGKFLEVAPELVIEVVSPTDSWEDIRAKLTDYFSIQVEQVWIVEPRNRSVLIYRSATTFEALGEGDLLQGEGILQGFQLEISSLFTP